MKGVLIVAGLFSAFPAWSQAPNFHLSLKEAERQALETSNELKAFGSTAEAAMEHADAQFSGLLPRLTLDGSYQYDTHVPTVSLPIPEMPSIAFGSHNIYSVGPTVSYTLWDTGASRNAYRGSSLLAQARQEDEKNTRLQVLLSVRMAYVRLQLALEELRLLNNSLQLSRAQNHDIEANFHAGAASQLDRVDSQRDVINYELQFEQKQAEVEADLKDVLALLHIPFTEKTMRPGPPGVPGVGLTLSLDSLGDSLVQTRSWNFQSPSENQPSVRAQALLAQSSERTAESQKAELYPELKVSASALIEYPDMINLKTVEQNAFMVSLSMPLFEGDRTHHLVAESRKQADAARFNEEQVRINLERDYVKAVEQLTSLKKQQDLAGLDVKRSGDSARLYYQSYKLGKINLIDVQSANNRALTAKVNAARVNAQILTQLFNLRAICGEEL